MKRNMFSLDCANQDVRVRVRVPVVFTMLTKEWIVLTSLLIANERS